MSPVSRRGIFVAVAVALVVAAVGVGLYVIGKPSDERVRRIDDRRVEDLSSIRATVNLYAATHGRLPPSLDAPPGGPMPGSQKDPVTNQPYGYRVTGDKTYELCADFSRDSDPDRQPFDRFWTHKAGRACFTIAADFPPKPR